MFKHILLAVDGSENALRAAKLAGDLARQMNAGSLHIVVSFDTIPPYLGDPNLQLAIDARMRASQDILRRAQEVVGPLPDGEIHTELIEGSAAETIIEVARTRSSELIVMGARGLGRIAAAVLGSVSQKVVAHAPCPVLIVR